MTNIDRAALVIAESITRDSAPAHEIVADLEHDGLLMPDPKIIRTVEELEALHPDTVVLDRDSTGGVYPVSQYLDSDEWEREVYRRYLPAVVIAPAEQVRAARKALEEA